MNKLINTFNLQKEFFNSNVLTYVENRILLLKKLKTNLKKYEKQLCEGLKLDFNKPEGDTFVSEIAIVYEEINTYIKKIKKWNKEVKVSRNILTIFSKSSYKFQPYGNCLIISTWNYPIQLTFVPLIDCLGTGNTAIIFISDYTPNTNKIIKKIIHETFDRNCVEVYTNEDVNYSHQFDVKYDLVFFTGGSKVGTYIAQQCAKTLTPCVLELGGKSPCIVDETCNIKKTVKRIIRGKILNAGQTCVAPDYFLIHKSIFDKFLHTLKQELTKMKINEENFTHIVNKVHYQRIQNLLKNENVIFECAKDNKKTNFISPKIIDIGKRKTKLMSEELFAPLFPLLRYDKIKKLSAELRTKDKPLALYIFSKNKKLINFIKDQTFSGGMCVNDTVMQIANNNLPFGGVGNSGIGNYHGFFGFKTFSHCRSIVDNSSIIDTSLMYPDYSSKKIKLFKKIIK